VADYVNIAIDDWAKLWLTSTLGLRWGVGPYGNSRTGARRDDLIRSIKKTMPGSYLEENDSQLALDLRLPDPADQFFRTSAFLALERAIVEAGFEAQIVDLVPWILMPAIRIITSKRDAQYRTAFESREEALRSASLRPLTPFLADPRHHGIGGSGAGFRAYHLELDPIERHIIRRFAYAPKTTARDICLVNPLGPYAASDIEAAAKELAEAGWIKNLHHDFAHPSSSSSAQFLWATRGKLLNGLDADSLLSNLW